MLLSSMFSPSLLVLLSEIEDLGFSLCLVGGAVRDYLMLGNLSFDLDFEIRSTLKFSDVEWPIVYQRLIKFLESKNLKIILFPYLITKVDFEGWSLEFSSPRLETYDKNSNELVDHSHHNFTATLSSNLSYKESFKRRDFTLNAIGFELSFKNNTTILVDPFSGETDLVNRRLKAIDHDFFRDSVRLLRLIRFKLKYQMTIDTSTEELIGNFNLSKLSKYHFTSELFKADAGSFLKLWREMIPLYKLKPPPEFYVWTDLTFDWPEKILASKEDILIYTFVKLPGSAPRIQVFFSLPEKALKDVKVFYAAILHLKLLNKENTKELLRLETTEVMDHQFIKSMKILEDKKELRPKFDRIIPGLEVGLLFKWENWDGIGVSDDELLAVDPVYRTLLKYYKALKMWVNQ